jgi:hypothetical protein
MKSSRHCYLYFVISSQQLLAVKALVANAPNDVDQYCFVFYQNYFEFTLPSCDIFYYSMRSWLGYLLSLYKFSIKIKNIRKNYDSCTIFIAHPWHIPTNYALFSMPHEAAYMIPDGTLNYSNIQISNSRYRKMWVKFFIGYLAALPYKPYKGHLTACDQNSYDGVYTFNPDALYSICGDTFTLLLPPSTSLSRGKTSSYTILFLDQPIEWILPSMESVMLRQTLWNYIKHKKFERILYKPHPSIINAKPPTAFLNSVEYVTSPLPVELLMDKYPINIVISFSSSALLTISDVYPEIKCVSIGLNKIVKYNNSQNLIDLFRSRGIELYEC